ncbi:hypothetical protein ABZT02_05010 [Streptomyces sp. NPDC005402]|uniref:hypothetical protein n=1 Tax=Streptomyces sp. NPDC005402 TaxID=3155338 RepID=UPI0033AFF236
MTWAFLAIVQRRFEAYATGALPAEPEEPEAAGIDETRRGKPVWKQNPDTGSNRASAITSRSARPSVVR